MPHWLVYHPPNTYTDSSSKDALVKAITDFYISVGMPAFYVVVNFIKVAHEDFYVGGVRRGPDDKPFIRFTINHVAHNYPDDDKVRREAGDVFNRLLTPLMKGKYDWEFHISETDRRLWKTNEFTPPEAGSEGLKLWVKENRPVPY
ncbi:putative oxalocrotonate tautomerase [Trichoderma sp. SZMC 28011]